MKCFHCLRWSQLLLTMFSMSILLRASIRGIRVEFYVGQGKSGKSGKVNKFFPKMLNGQGIQGKS